MKSIITTCVLIFPFLLSASLAQSFSCEDAPEGTIFCDDFEDSLSLEEKYFEYGGVIVLPGVGRDGSKGLRVVWQAGEVGAGGMKKSFGRTPSAYIGKNSVRPEEDFDEIYWRMDVKAQEGWQGGGPAKLSRALCLANANWATGLMAHLWSAGEGSSYLGMDPASGVSADGRLVSTKYNDFDNLRWLGFKKGDIPIFADETSGRWYCVEGHVRLNTPGESEGVFEFWIDDSLQAGTYNLNWHGDWNSNPDNYKINAIFFENYWNSGSPVEQERYFDNLVISTERIGCGCASSKEDRGDYKFGLEVVPNPASDRIKAKVTLSKSKVTRIKIVNATGVVIENVEDRHLPIGESVYNINIGDLPAGFYNLVVICGGDVIAEKIIKR